MTAAWDRLLRQEKTAGVRAALEAVDADPYRDAVRDAVLANDAAKMADLAGQPETLAQPPEFVAFLGESEVIGVGRRRQLLEAAVGRRPGDLGLLMTLGYTYPTYPEDRTGERLRWSQAAVAAAPTNPTAHNYLGIVLLFDRQDLAGAEAACREALRLDPKFALAHANLGNVLLARQDPIGAEAAFREALRLDPKVAVVHYNLGRLLVGKQDQAGAEAAFGEALRLDPKLAAAHFGLATVLLARKDLAGAEAACREALRLDPTSAFAHYNLGWILQEKGDLEGAVAEYQKALRLDAKQANALANLPLAERMRQLLPRLPDMLAGKAEPATADEACEFARLCAQPFQKRYAAAARLFDGAFTADPKLAADLTPAHRYYASTYAVLAAGGEGIDPPADAAARTVLREKAFGWLRADLDLRRKQAASADAAERATAAGAMGYWLADASLSGVREPGPLAKLPAAERSEWETLWANVKATLADAQKPPE